MVYAIGGISGYHINPAIKISMLVERKIAFKEAISYIIAQLIAAAFSDLLLFQILIGIAGFSMG